MRLPIFVTSLLLTVVAQAIPQNELEAKFASQLLPGLNKSEFRGSFVGVSNIRVNYLVVPAQNPKGVIIISPGQAEPALKYAELVHDLKGLGYTFYIIDHRGQGASQRMLADPQRSHVEQFADYVTDFSHFVMQIVRPRSFKNSFILAHSMGGAIATGFLKHHPLEVTGVILSAPMFRANTAYWGRNFSIWLAQQLDSSGLGSMYAPGQKPFNPRLKFADNTVTTSPERFKMLIKLMRLMPELQVGGTTVRWTREALTFTQALKQIGGLFQVPTILFQAANDEWVMGDGQVEACTLRSPGRCRIIPVAGAKHEILMEKDSIREPILDEIIKFISQQESK